MTTVPVASIVVGDRARKVYSNIDTLAASITSLGLLHPIVVTADRELVAGGRRLEAVKAMGWSEVPVTVAESLSGLDEVLRAESDENTEREPLKPSEAADLAAKIEAVLAPMREAERREKITASRRDGTKLAPSPKTADVAAKAAGSARETIRKTRHVQEVIESEATPEPVREIATAALAEIDATGKVDAGHKKVRAASSAADAVSEFPDLAHYFDNGDHATVNRLANALRNYSEPELSARLNNLRLTIAAEKRKSGEAQPDDGPDYVALADAIFVALNNAGQVIEKNGGAETVRRATESATSIEIEMWRRMFDRIQPIAQELSEATRPQLRRVQ